MLVVLTSLLVASPVLALTPNDSLYDYQAKMWKQVGAPAAWDYTTGSKQVIVAEIDTGVDTGNADLMPNLWVNKKEIVDNGVDDDNNGYTDDINGWNFIDNNNNVETPPELTANSISEVAVHHGTISAGLIGAVGNNGLYGVGVNWNVSIMVLRAVGNNGAGSLADIARAVDYAVANGASVISLSLVGREADPNLEKSLKKAYDSGVLVVAAAGNNRRSGEGDLEKNPLYPICADRASQENWILGVTSVDPSDRLSEFADYGSCVDLAAPGENIYSVERYDPSAGLNEEFGGGWQGTSFAVPLVAGAAALIKAVQPDWGALEITEILLKTSDNIDDTNLSLAGRVGYGRLNIGKAVAAAKKFAAISGEAGRVYYYSGNAVYLKNNFGGSDKLLAKTGSAKIIGISSVDVDGDGANDAVLLLRRDKYHYVRILSKTGELLKEFSLPFVWDGKKATVIQLQTGLSGGTAVLTIGWRKSGVKKTTFVRYDADGKRVD